MVKLRTEAEGWANRDESEVNVRFKRGHTVSRIKGVLSRDKASL